MIEVCLDDIDLWTNYNFAIGVDPKHADGPALSDATAPLLGAFGPSWLGEPTQAGTRQMTIGGSLVNATAAAMLANLDTMKALAYSGTKRIRLADRPTQEFRDARCIGFSATARAAILANRACDVSMNFEIDEPIRFDVNPQGIPLSTARASLPIGTAPAAPVIIVHGAGASLSGITLTYRTAAGDSAQTMGLTGSLASTDYLIIDCAKTWITKVASGVSSDAISWFTSGDFLDIRPADGDYSLSQYPTLELAGTGTPVGACRYWRQWL